MLKVNESELLGVEYKDWIRYENFVILKNVITFLRVWILTFVDGIISH